jgi:hypothetical protein
VNVEIHIVRTQVAARRLRRQAETRGAQVRVTRCAYPQAGWTDAFRVEVVWP